MSSPRFLLVKVVVVAHKTHREHVTMRSSSPWLTDKIHWPADEFSFLICVRPSLALLLSPAAHTILRPMSMFMFRSLSTLTYHPAAAAAGQPWIDVGSDMKDQFGSVSVYLLVWLSPTQRAALPFLSGRSAARGLSLSLRAVIPSSGSSSAVAVVSRIDRRRFVTKFQYLMEIFKWTIFSGISS